MEACALYGCKHSSWRLFASMQNDLGGLPTLGSIVSFTPTSLRGGTQMVDPGPQARPLALDKR